METVNVFTAENEGRIDVARAVGSTGYEMFVYDVPPGESSCPYHYEYEEEWLLVVEGEVVVRAPDGEHTLQRGDLACFPAGADGAHKGDEPRRVARADAAVLALGDTSRLRVSGQRQDRCLPGRRGQRFVLQARHRGSMV
jgi:uncharacterized cupin superfamily protein